MKKILAFSLFFVVLSAAIAQKPDSKHQERWEKYRAEKVAFLTTHLDFSPEEAQRFWPLYNQLEKERLDAQMQRKAMELKVLEAEKSMSDERIKQLTREFAGSMKNEAELLSTYNEKFLEVLPPRKVLELYKAENEFRMYMIKKFRDKRKNGE